MFTDVFKDLKVVELAGVLAGPSVGMFFAELGAKVIKIENTIQPDVTRTWKTPTEDPKSNVSAYFSSINYKKEYLSLNLKSKDDFEKLIVLLQESDILLTNFKKGSAEKLGLSDTQIRQINPKLIHGKISGFGGNSERVAYDLIIQAESGFMSINGEPDGKPTKMPVALIDVLTAHQLKEGILCALIERERTGQGCVIESSLYETAVSSLINQASTYLMEGIIPSRIGSKHPSIAPYGEIFTTKDNSQITFAIGSQTHFEKLVQYLNLKELIQDVRFCDNQSRVKNRTELEIILQNKINQLESKVLLDWAIENYVPAGKIKQLNEVLDANDISYLKRIEIIDGIETKRITSIAFKKIDDYQRK